MSQHTSSNLLNCLGILHFTRCGGPVDDSPGDAAMVPTHVCHICSRIPSIRLWYCQIQQGSTWHLVIQTGNHITRGYFPYICGHFCILKIVTKYSLPHRLQLLPCYTIQIKICFFYIKKSILTRTIYPIWISVALCGRNWSEFSEDKLIKWHKWPLW